MLALAVSERRRWPQEACRWVGSGAFRVICSEGDLSRIGRSLKGLRECHVKGRSKRMDVGPELRGVYEQEREVCDGSAQGWHRMKCVKVCG